MLPPLASQDNNFAQDLDEYTYDNANQDEVYVHYYYIYFATKTYGDDVRVCTCVYCSASCPFRMLLSSVCVVTMA